ncbi:MAG: hypothetical protein WC707_00920 [Candidatus Babeliaceae bacterium]|jgi:hypothetical protein
MKNKVIVAALSIFIMHSSASCGVADVSAPVKNFVVPLGLYAAGFLFAHHTLVDCGYRYIDIKKVYYACKEQLTEESKGLLSEQEIEFFSRLQGISAMPSVYWREIASTAITIALFYAGTRCLRQAL